MDYLIDIVGTCNLKCPSCPVGNFSNADFADAKRPRGFMDFDLFEKIVEKAQQDCVVRSEPINIYLYNWGEALIHPRIAEFVSLLSAKRIPFYISSNMNNDAPIQKIVRAEPAGFRISLSGFSQPTYGRGHVGGDANLVISNMYRLRSAMDACESEMPVEVFYHVYKDNCGDELLRMAQLCDSLGFYLHPVWAYFMGLEKLLDHLEGKSKFSQEDQAVLDRLVVSLDESITIAQQAKSPTCYLKTHQTVINHDGAVALCCAIYDPIHFVAPNFLSISDADLQHTREQAGLCGKCMSYGLHDLGMYQPNDLWDAIGNRNQVDWGQAVTITTFSRPHIHVRRETKVEALRHQIRRVIGIKAQ